MLPKWNLFIFVILLTFFTGLTGSSNPLFLNSIATQSDKSVLGVSDTPLSQVTGVKITEQKYTPTPSPLTKQEENPYGKSRKINENTWTIEVPRDSRTATPSEILAALNTYRQKKGLHPLSWDNKLADYARERAAGFATNNALDGHAGFMDFVNNQDGFLKVGFGKLGENSAIGFVVTGTKLIEVVYAGDAPHDENQLASKWSHVGIGVSGTASNLVFGGDRL